MRIISGEAKGRTLYAPQGLQTRPTSDKLRGSLFNILGARVAHARVLDLFGGTGALALEALSRGADYAVIADNARAAIQAIERNARSVLKDEYDARVRVVRGDYRSVLSGLSGPAFDLVFLDPPYRMLDAYGDALNRLEAAGLLSSDGLAVLERLRDVSVPLPESFEHMDTRTYGDTAVDFIRLASGFTGRIYDG